MKTVLFYRDYLRFQGGHLNVWHYFNHVLHSPEHVPAISFSARSRLDGDNPWRTCPEYMVEPDAPPRADVLFFGAYDWDRLTEAERRSPPAPVIALVQNPGYARSDDRRSRSLGYPAVRVCISNEVADALIATGRVAGPVFAIPNAVDPGELPEPLPPGERDLDFLVVAPKQRALGLQLCARLWRPGRRGRVLLRWRARQDFLHLLRRARVAVLLPCRLEGLYLPALEAMALGVIVVCPDCVGNRSVCVPGETAFRPEYTAETILSAAEEALRLDVDQRGLLLAGAAETVARHSPGAEREAFLEILSQIDRLV
jgi:Glycosyl transferases group 1